MVPHAEFPVELSPLDIVIVLGQETLEVASVVGDIGTGSRSIDEKKIFLVHSIMGHRAFAACGSCDSLT
jgi:hypothetical protein